MLRQEFKLAMGLLLGSLIIALGSARAESPAPDLTADQVRVSTPMYQADLAAFEPPLGTYTYRVSWEGIGAAEAKFTVARDGGYYHVEGSARTNSFIDLFYRMRFFAKALISAKNLHPTFSTASSRENSRRKDSEITFFPDGTVAAVRRENGKEPFTLKFNPNNFMLDPFSAAFLARGLHWELGETKEFDTFNGKTRYLISLTAIDKTEMDVNGERKSVWVISPKVKKLTGSGEDGKKLRTARIYVTDDKARDVLKIESEVFVGTVTTKLTSYTALSGATAVANRAKPRDKSVF